MKPVVVEWPERHRGILQLVTSAQRDLAEAQHHLLEPDPSPLSVATIRLRLLSAAGHALSAGQEAMRGCPSREPATMHDDRTERPPA